MEKPSLVSKPQVRAAEAKRDLSGPLVAVSYTWLGSVRVWAFEEWGGQGRRQYETSFALILGPRTAPLCNTISHMGSVAGFVEILNLAHRAGFGEVEQKRCMKIEEGPETKFL